MVSPLLYFSWGFKLLKRIIPDLSLASFRKRLWLRSSRPSRRLTVEKMVATHFQLFSSRTHVNYPAFLIVLRHLNELPARIFETGTSAWGTDSTRLWAKYVQTFGGSLQSVDLRTEPSITLGDLGPRVTFAVSDSVNFMASTFGEGEVPTLDFVYLDSFDVDFADALPAATHCLDEWNGIREQVSPGGMVLIDDTPRNMRYLGDDVQPGGLDFIRRYGVVPGKGSFVVKAIADDPDWQIVYHQYSLLLQKNR